MASDATISGLTFAYAQNAKELDRLVTREFHADPNLHKNSNVQFLGDFGTHGNPSITYEWTWHWKPPKAQEDKGGGWRNCCSFLEYDSRAHRLNTLASFTFWVHNVPMYNGMPLASPGLEIPMIPQRHRVPSSQSYQSAISDSEGPFETHNPPSPQVQSAEFALNASASAPPLPVIDIQCLPRPGEDVTAVDDGPLFRATMKALEQKTGNMKIQIKKVLKKAEAAQEAQVGCNQAMSDFLKALQEASNSSSTAFKPALDHYFTNIAQHIMKYEKGNSTLLQKQIIDPISKLYNLDIKQVEAKKKDFDDESRDYYAYVGRYLGQRQDSLKDKKRAESDSKYQSKRKNFELKRFDYSTFMQDLHGGRKEQELLSQLTKYADGQAKSFLTTAKKVENLTPQLDALVREVSAADKDYNLQRTEREEKRRNIEKNGPTAAEQESHHQAPTMTVSTQASGQNGYNAYTSDTDLSRADSTSSQFGQASIKTLSPTTSSNVPLSAALSASPSGNSITPTPNKFKGIRDLDESSVSTDKTLLGQYRKEGLLWALSKPNTHSIDPKGAWHKFWIVLDQGKLSEYSNWKDRLDLHREPIDLRMASVRMARDAERRFCFEVITPQYKRVYQATSEEDMNHWINAINNALQSAFEAGGQAPQQIRKEPAARESIREFGHALLGKSSSTSGAHGYSHRNDASGVSRRITVGSRPTYTRTSSNSYDENPSKLLDQIRNNDHGNQFCADCGSTSKVEWVSLNLGIILCIECGGIHRSLGTHVSKIRSLTLDVHSFTNDIVDLLMLIGNRISNMVWEAVLDRSMKPSPTATRDQRLKFITSKYVERAFVAPVSQYVTADDTLLTSIKKHEIQGVLQSVAQRANVNAHDRSRNTHAVFLALAASDPARPVSSHAEPSPGAVKAFPMAELLVQNGAEIPVEMPSIPLSAAARLYIDQRTTRAPPNHSGHTDTLSPLPIMQRVSPMSSSSDGSNKLQKRGSAGARFAGRVAGLGER